MRHGWLPADPHEPMLYLKHYIRKARSISVPSVIDWSGRAGSNFPLLGNGDWGDCVEAAAYHIDQVLGGGSRTPVEEDALTLYANVTGFNGTPQTDQGTDIPTLLNWWMKNGLPGSGTKLLGWVAVDINDPVELDYALYLGGNIMTGFMVPYSAEQQFNRGQVWDYVDSRSPIVGGHSTALYGSGDFAPLEGSTWGSTYGMTDKFWKAYGQESYLLFAEEWVLNPAATNNIDWNTLNGDLNELFGVGPFTDPGTTSGASSIQVLGEIKAALNSWNGA